MTRLRAGKTITAVMATALIALLGAFAAGCGDDDGEDQGGPLSHEKLVAQADAMLETNVPFEPALAELAMLMQRVALHQAGVPVPGEDAELLERLAAQLRPEDVQVHYQIAIHGQRDLPLAPDPHTGFTMTLLRMLAFRPDDGGERPAGGAPRARACCDWTSPDPPEATAPTGRGHSPGSSGAST